MCTAELRGLGEVNRELQSQGGRLLAISVDPPATSKDVVERNGLDFPILSDADRTVTRAYGLLHEGGARDGSDIAIPAHVLIDRHGRIVSTFVSKRIQARLSPKRVLATVQKLREPSGPQDEAGAGLPSPPAESD